MILVHPRLVLPSSILPTPERLEIMRTGQLPGHNREIVMAWARDQFLPAYRSQLMTLVSRLGEITSCPCRTGAGKSARAGARAVVQSQD